MHSENSLRVPGIMEKQLEANILSGKQHFCNYFHLHLIKVMFVG